MQDAPELSDLVIDFDPDTLARRPVLRAAVLEELRRHDSRWALRIAERFPSRDGVLEEPYVDRTLVRSHLELQRLHEEFLMGARMREVLDPVLRAARALRPGAPLRVVDLGCGLGYVLRWLSKRGSLGADVTLTGADYNAVFTRVASLLAQREGLSCRFHTGNALRLEEPASVLLSTGVLHHFRGPSLAQTFAQQAASGALALVHFDIKPSLLAPVGSWIFHQARMREPLARYDGYLSSARAHSEERLRGALTEGAPSLRHAIWDGQLGLTRLARIMHALVAVRPELEPHLRRELGPEARRLSSFEGGSA